VILAVHDRVVGQVVPVAEGGLVIVLRRRRQARHEGAEVHVRARGVGQLHGGHAGEAAAQRRHDEIEVRAQDARVPDAVAQILLGHGEAAALARGGGGQQAALDVAHRFQVTGDQLAVLAPHPAGEALQAAAHVVEHALALDLQRLLAGGVAGTAAEQSQVDGRGIEIGHDGLLLGPPAAVGRARQRVLGQQIHLHAHVQRRTRAAAGQGQGVRHHLIQRLAGWLLVPAPAAHHRPLPPEHDPIAVVARGGVVHQPRGEQQVVLVGLEGGAALGQRLRLQRPLRGLPVQLAVAVDLQHADQVLARGQLGARARGPQQRQAGGADAQPLQQIAAAQVPVDHGTSSPSEGERWVKARVRVKATISSRRS
jgi:hypothetical protein